MSHRIIQAAQAIAYEAPVQDPLLRVAGALYLSWQDKDYDPSARPRQGQVYLAPHVPGRPTSESLS